MLSNSLFHGSLHLGHIFVEEVRLENFSAAHEE